MSITSPGNHSKLAPIVEAAGDTILSAGFLGKGARCAVWKIRGANRSYVLRVFNEGAKGLPVGPDATLRGALLAAGARVAEPVLNSTDPAAPSYGRAWSLDIFQRGSAFDRDRATPSQMGQLGGTLRHLHDLDLERVGLNALPSVGMPFPVAGLRESLVRASAGTAARIAAEIRSLETELLSALGEDAACRRPCHADIHEMQVLLNGDSKLALLDFSELCIAHPHWDLGAVLAMAGRDLFASLAEGYGLSPTMLPVVFRSAELQARLHAIGINRSRSRAARRYLAELGA